ncbi:flagellar protein FliT [Pseudorhodoferax sp. Leaf265]|jgi:flagellar protein FliT|uniref:flagellar protein FliT n=1 Tax=Pseudorhodoferax sp. Leaf265 TaxID=1736315 RepID=UPI0006FACCDA|nr:flagellar protein FliT [Pseudorhodoferax sp. Leaf265]KQP08324.1 flagellar export protein FliJ [Pseudorhodoferax sp. Leaf265]PZP91663.1 MAG: flagellar protein FliT [Variovorax paradoxus]PZQ01686.1 MAG: flagellar protein FliT [Variovorax paradoxus]
MSHMLIDYYKAIEDSSVKMLRAAQQEDWDEVVRHEGACAVLIEQLRHQSQTEQLTAEQRKEKARIMQRILRNDAEIRCLTEPWLTQFEYMMESRPQLLH